MTSRSSSAATRFEVSDDEPTALFDTLGGLVREPAVVVDVTAPAADVRHVLANHRVAAVIVCDRNHRLHGLITRTDVLYGAPDARAGDVMSGCVFALPATASIMRAAALIGYEGVGQVVVTDEHGGLLGLVSAVDLVRYFAVYTGALAT